MQLYFVRHGSAASKSTWTRDDASRPLTSTGRERVRNSTRALVAAKAFAPQLVVSSPLLRARETADIVCSEVAADVRLAIDDRLAHGFDLTVLRRLLAENPQVQQLALVGHNPEFGAVLGALLGGADVEMRKGAIAAVEITDVQVPAGRLVWLAPTAIFPVAQAGRG